MPKPGRPSRDEYQTFLLEELVRQTGPWAHLSREDFVRALKERFKEARGTRDSTGDS